MTRAEEEVILSAASFRRRWDRPGAAELSRFVREIPSDLLSVESPLIQRPSISSGGGGWSRGDSGRTAASPSFPGTANTRDPAVNKRVYHEKFGRGRVLSAEGQGADKRFSIEFQDGEIRKVLARFLTGLDDD